MTQTAQKPVQFTLTTMLAKFEEGFPSLVEPFERIKPDLEKGTGAQVLANLIGCEVEVRAEQDLTVYSWAGRSDIFELSIPKPFEPRPATPQRDAAAGAGARGNARCRPNSRSASRSATTTRPC